MQIAAQEWAGSSAQNKTRRQPSGAGLAQAQAHAETPALYQQLAHHLPGDAVRAASAQFLRDQIAQVACLPDELPSDPQDLMDWMAENAQVTTAKYAMYRQERKAGKPRRYFTNRAHALNFLRSVAPTKLVDGAWLYGLVAHWRNQRFDNLVRTYLEELGDGDPRKNHVVLYRDLLMRHGLDSMDDLAPELYVQGLVQLSLGWNADAFLPEVIGFNLGYEQLPLHLLITAYELNELGLDPYYFTLHVTVDNTDSGHARRACQAVLDCLPRLGDGADFWRRVRAGSKLANAGKSTVQIIGEFDITREVVRIFSRKSVAGRGAHSDYCRIEGRMVNDWLSQPDHVPDFVDALQRAGWIMRGKPVEESRFWCLLQGPRAEMFGVFSPYELQVIHDWIRGPQSADGRSYDSPRRVDGAQQRVPSFRALSRAGSAGPSEVAQLAPTDSPALDALDPDIQALRDLLDGKNETGKMEVLVSALSPALHWTPSGLAATRLFCELQKA